MADFYSILKSAIGDVSSLTQSEREMLYGRARAALTAQLEQMDPPLGEEVLAAQFATLDEAIARLEAEAEAARIDAAAAKLEDAVAAAVKVPAAPPAAPAQSVAENKPAEPAQRVEPKPADKPADLQNAAAQPSKEASPAAEPVPDVSADAKPAPKLDPLAAGAPPEKKQPVAPAAPAPGPVGDPGPTGSSGPVGAKTGPAQDKAASPPAAGLAGGVQAAPVAASAPLNKPAVQPVAPAPRPAPKPAITMPASMIRKPGGMSEARLRDAEEVPAPPGPRAAELVKEYAASTLQAIAPELVPPPPPVAARPAADMNRPAEAANDMAPAADGGKAKVMPQPAGPAAANQAGTPRPMPPRQGKPLPKAVSRSSGGKSGLVFAGLALLVLIAGGSAAWYARDTILQMMDGQVATSTPQSGEPAATPAPSGETLTPTPVPTQTVTVEPATTPPAAEPAAPAAPPVTATGSETPPAPAAAPVVATPDTAATAPVQNKDQDRVPQQSDGAERAALVIEDQAAGSLQEARFDGTAKWSVVGEGNDAALRFVATLPSRSATFEMNMKRNTDANLPASHIIEFIYNVTGNAPEGQVKNVLGILMRDSEEEAGVPLRGAGALIVPGQYLIGLSSSEEDVIHNLDQLRKGNWLAVPALFENDKRALFMVHKGENGAVAIDKALQEWGHGG